MGQIDPGLLELGAPQKQLAPRRHVFDTLGYSLRQSPAFNAAVRAYGTDTLLLSEGETAICVLATALGAMERGYFVFLIEDALCCAKDESHNAALTIFKARFSVQLSVINT